MKDWHGDFQRTDYFCPHCGAAGRVACLPREDDYYVGFPYICGACGGTFGDPLPSQALRLSASGRQEEAEHLERRRKGALRFMLGDEGSE